MIEDNPFSPFPQIMSTERPDVACASLLEGRAVILVEGTPFTLIAPINLLFFDSITRGLCSTFLGRHFYPLVTIFFMEIIPFASITLCCYFDIPS